MDLTFRPATLEDWLACMDVLRPAYGNDPALLARLPELWRRLFALGATTTSVVEDRALPEGDRIVAVGAGVYVTDAFAEYLKTDSPPFLAANLVRALEETPMPLLDARAIREANARGGVNACVLHYGFPGVPAHVLPDRRIHEKHFEAYHHFHPWVNAREVLREMQGEAWRDWMLAAGARIRRDYAEHDAAHPEPPHRRRWLVGMTRAEAAENEGTRLSAVFLHAPPRLGLSAPQQEMLRRAADGETDEELAESLCLTLSAVKKRWAAVYRRVETVMPGLLPPGGEASGRRGAERRRALLHYLRGHPEELYGPESWR